MIGLLTLGGLSYRQSLQEMRGDGFRRRASGLLLALVVGAGLAAGLAATTYESGAKRPTHWRGLGDEGQAVLAGTFALTAVSVAGLVWRYWLRPRAGVAGVAAVAGAALAALALSVMIPVLILIGLH